MKNERRSLLQIKILLYLEEKPAKTITELAKRIDSLRPSVSRSLQLLEEQELVYHNHKGWYLTETGRTEATQAKRKLANMRQQAQSIVQRTNEALTKGFSKIKIPSIEKEDVVRTWFRHEVFEYLKDLHEYANVTENFIAAMAEKAKYLSEDENDYWRFSENFPYLLRSSLVVMCFSFLEHRLNELCGFLCKLENLDKKWKEYSKEGKGISRAKSYLKNEAGVTIPYRTTFWNSIRKYERIRNIIVHSDGYLDETDKRNNGVPEFIDHRQRTTGSITVNELHYIELEKNFCSEILDDFELFFSRLLSDNWPAAHSIES